MSQRVSGYHRQADEHYVTPVWVARILADYLRGQCRHIWAPADTEKSPLVDTLHTAGFAVTATVDDFFSRRSLPHRGIDAIGTNPPFGVGGRTGVAFIKHALELAPVVAMLTRIDFDSGKTRTGLFRDCPAFAHKIVLLDRIVWFAREGASGPSENHCWLIWNRRHRGPPTIGYAGMRPCR
jgi:hypothetical protein